MVSGGCGEKKRLHTETVLAPCGGIIRFRFQGFLSIEKVSAAVQLPCQLNSTI